MIQATKTVNPLHFEDLEPHRFEDLVRQLSYGFKKWRTLEATGRLGQDEGVDIRGVEIVPLEPITDYDESEAQEDIPVEERVWVFQCKRYKRITPQIIRKTVAEAVPDGSEAPYGLIIAVACDVTKTTMDAFRKEARAKEVQEFELWTKARLEDLLFQPRFDHLLFAYFDISLTTRRRTQLTKVRKDLNIKRKLLKALDVGNQDLDTQLSKAVLVRDIADEHYPRKWEIPNFSALTIPPWHPAKATQFWHRGILLALAEFKGWVQEDGTWDILTSGPNLILNFVEVRVPDDLREEPATHSKEEKQLLEEIPEKEKATIAIEFLLPYRNIVEVDAIGDTIYHYPHLYCSFLGADGPYLKNIYVARMADRHTRTQLDDEKRVDLFPKKE